MEVVYEDPVDYTYNIYYADGTSIGDTTGYGWAVLDLVNGTEYGFYATSQDDEGNESEPTPTVFVTPTSEPLLPPENLQGEAGVLSASLTWDPPFVPQPGDIIETAVEVEPTLPIELLGTTDGYLDDYDEICPAESDSPDKVYSLSPSTDITVDIDLCGSAYDTKVFVYENEYTPNAPYACDDDFNGSADECGGAWTSMIPGLVLSAGSTYYIVIDGWGGGFGDFIVNITESTGLISGINNPINDRLALGLKTLALEERNANRTTDRDLLGYVVHRAIADGEFVSIDTVAETEYLDTGLTADIEHHYQVTSVYPDGESDPIGPVTVVPVEDADLPAPTNLVGEARGWFADLSWTAPNTGGAAGVEEDFEGGAIPEGWVMSTLADCGDFSGWFVTMDGSSAWWTIPPGDGYYAVANDDECNTDGSEDYLTLPSQDFSGGGLAVNFDSFFDGAY
ncbi:MAG: hypothetical protein NZ777_05255, partial [Pseudomonadales bacterium]|nr:hypothetical protein [Pseudomonadales bacterium]